eukprot:gene4482-5585_t
MLFSTGGCNQFTINFHDRIMQSPPVVFEQDEHKAPPHSFSIRNCGEKAWICAFLGLRNPIALPIRQP